MLPLSHLAAYSFVYRVCVYLCVCVCVCVCVRECVFAMWFYGLASAKTTLKAIVENNPDLLDNSDLREGQKICLLLCSASPTTK